MLNKPIIFSLLLAVLSCVLGISYFISFKHFLFDYITIIPFWKLIATYFFLSFLITFLFKVYLRVFAQKYLLVFNLFLVLISFCSILYPIQAQVFHPDEEFFPVFAIPLHFIVPLFWLTFYHLIIPHENH